MSFLLTLAHKPLTHTVLQNDSRSFFQECEIKVSGVVKGNTVFGLVPQKSVELDRKRVRIAAEIGDILPIHYVLKCVDLKLETKLHKINRTLSHDLH